METIIKSAKHLALILGIGERAVTIRANKVKLKEYVLNKKAFKGEISMGEAAKRIIEIYDQQLAGYSCHVNDDEGKRVITFYKNV